MTAGLKALVALLMTARVGAHSWVACTDYRVANPDQAPQGPSDKDPARRVYDDSKCHAYGRDWNQYDGSFGADTGYNYISTPDAVCKTPRGTDDYTVQYPMATYSPGQTVCLAYPAKNHAAAPCTNAFIPDTKFSIYRSGLNPASDPNLDGFKQHPISHKNGVHQNGVIDYKGFQNCPDFCGAAGTGLATCSVCFDLEADLAPGKYTFLWYWEFNGGDPYTSCWEAKVTGDAVSPTPRPPSPTPKPTAKSPTPTPKLPTPKPTSSADMNCFCQCNCEDCWHKCRCSTAGARATNPFASGPAPTPSPTPKVTTRHPTRQPTSMTPTQPPQPTQPGNSCVGNMQQCGGAGFGDERCCTTAGWSCQKQTDTFWQCREGPQG